MKKLIGLVLIFTLAFTSVGSVLAGEELGVNLERRSISTGNAGTLGNLSKYGDDYNFQDNIFVDIEDININGSEINLIGSVTNLNTRQIERFNFAGELLKSNIHENKYIGDLKDKLGNFHAVHFSIDENFKTMGEASLKTYLNSKEEPGFTDSFSMSRRFSNEMENSKTPIKEMMLQDENTIKGNSIENNSRNIIGRGRSFGGSAINLYLMNDNRDLIFYEDFVRINGTLPEINSLEGAESYHELWYVNVIEPKHNIHIDSLESLEKNESILDIDTYKEAYSYINNEPFDNISLQSFQGNGGVHHITYEVPLVGKVTEFVRISTTVKPQNYSEWSTNRNGRPRIVNEANYYRQINATIRVEENYTTINGRRRYDFTNILLKEPSISMALPGSNCRFRAEGLQALQGRGLVSYGSRIKFNVGAVARTAIDYIPVVNTSVGVFDTVSNLIYINPRNRNIGTTFPGGRTTAGYIAAELSNARFDLSSSGERYLKFKGYFAGNPNRVRSLTTGHLQTNFRYNLSLNRHGGNKYISGRQGYFTQRINLYYRFRYSH